MPLPPARDHRIPLAEAVALTKAHRGHAANAPRGGFFHAAQVRELLDQSGCAGLRYYHGRNKDSSPLLVLVGVDADGKDMTADGVVLELALPCPPYCGEGSPLDG